jgi:microcystin-dependent protein
MAVGIRYAEPNPFEVDANGVPLAGAQLYFFASGTNTPQATYSDVALSIANTNPIIADANGRFGAIFLITSNAYQVQLWTAATTDNPTGSQIWTQDPVGPASGGAVSNVTGIIGEVRQFAGIAAAIPSGWYECYGQAVSRTTYAAAFAVMGTSWGAGDSSTTFNLPDLRGRVTAGIDNMGGSAANRVTSGVSGISGVTLGAAGGDQHSQVDTLSATSNAATVVTDPGHLHQVPGSIINGSGGSATTGGVTTFPAPISNNGNTTTATTGVTVTTTVSTTVTSAFTGESQNMPPAAMVFSIIYLGV